MSGSRKKHVLHYLLLAALLLAPGLSHAWWNDQWPYRVPIAVNSAATGADLRESATDATVLVKLHSGNFEDFFSVKEDLADLRFIGEDDKTPLKFHVEHFDPINQLLYVWVKLPQVSPGIDTARIWMYYGNAAATVAQDSGGSFDNATALVYHFGGVAPMPQDATANGLHAQAMTAATTPGALIAAGLKFEGGTTVTMNDAPALAVNAERGATLSFWMKPAGLQTDAVLLSRSGGGAELSIGLDQNALYARLKLANGVLAETNKVSTVRVDNWQHVALVLAPTQLGLWVDGVEVAKAPIQLQGFGGAFTLGNSAQGGHSYAGELDELRIDGTARSGDWLRLQVANQGVENRLLQVAQAEQLGAGAGGHSGFWKVIIGSQDEAGWTVLILLFIMTIISWIVMVGKSLYVSRVTKDNDRFLNKYRELGDADPALLDRDEPAEDQALAGSPIAQALFGKHDHFQSSPIYRVYHRAVQETRARIGASVGARAAGLNDAAIASIRATLDTQIVREMQRLNSQMVLLTIGVAGGPFIGLLGTVIGVMIVFSAIAQSGDVNINAIAPGVAAALAATVMGLIVAIPSLFGYNYLMSKIKAITADIRVFSDELVTRLAEYYGK